jgi:hypothetical protein
VSPPLEEINNAPVLDNPIVDRTATDGELLSFRVPGNTFSDIDAGDTLSYSATLEDGSPLPDWLNFNQEYHAFSGTPGVDDVGELQIKVTATDSVGATVSDVFILDVSGVGGTDNQAPVLGNPIADQSAAEDVSFSFQIPSNTFSDADVGDALALAATLADGSPLPSWLTFDSVKNTFNGTPDNSAVGLLNVRVTATDNAGESVSDVFALDVVNVNDAPVVDNLIANQIATEDAGFNFQLPSDLFSDADAGDTLILSATLDDDSQLPSWLSFNQVTGVFSGIPANEDVGEISIKVIATDRSGVTAATIFDLNVVNVNDAPELINSLADAEAVEGDNFSYMVSTNAFRDVDVGDGLTYTATISDGNELPSWLSFDSSTMTLAGELPMDAAGEYDITIQAMDSLGASASDTFHLSVTNLVNDPVWGGEFFGTSSNDVIIGGDNYEWLRGWHGNDRMIADAGRDKLFGGDGQDTIFNSDTAPDSADTLSFNDIDLGDLLFSRRWDDLIIDVVGTDDKVTVKNWYLDDGFQLDTIEVDEDRLQSDQVNQLVNAMAQFDVPAGSGSVVGNIQDHGDQPLLIAFQQ